MKQMQADRKLTGRQIIVVMGVSASGKSTVGAGIAAALGCPFIEGDDLHLPASVAKMSAGQPLTDEDRWPWLDAVGRGAGRTAAEHGHAVASCSALKRVYRQRLEEAAGMPIAFVLLDLDRDALAQRLGNRPGHFMPTSLLSSQLATLERPGADEAALVLDAHAPPATLIDDVLEALGLWPEARRAGT